MATVDQIRNGLIDKILSIQNEDFLKALDNLIVTSASQSDEITLSSEQKEMLSLSDADIQYDKLISQSEMTEKNLEWLNGI
ncbi:MAG: hypothetical protein ACI9N1_001098 [Flavobacteriales bacterium]|jgi:hypothetical protein